MTSNKEFRIRIVNVKPKPEKFCNHSWRTLWNDYYSWGAECIKCGKGESGDH